MNTHPSNLWESCDQGSVVNGQEKMNPTMMNGSRTNSYGIQNHSQMILQPVRENCVQQPLSNNGHHNQNQNQINGSNGQVAYNSSNNSYQVEVRANGSNVLLTNGDHQYQYPIDPSYGSTCPENYGPRIGSWSCINSSSNAGLELPKSKMFYLLSTLIVLGIVTMILTLISAIVIYYQCEC